MPRDKHKKKTVPMFSWEELFAMSYCFKNNFIVDFIPVDINSYRIVETVKIVINNNGKKTIVPIKGTNEPMIVKMDDLWQYERQLYMWFYNKRKNK